MILSIESSKFSLLIVPYRFYDVANDAFIEFGWRALIFGRRYGKWRDK